LLLSSLLRSFICEAGIALAPPEDHYRANFGQGHSFRISESDYRNHRFSHGGYSFGFMESSGSMITKSHWYFLHPDSPG